MASGSLPFGFGSASNFLGFIDVSHASHFLKLRQNFKASKQLRVQLGLDFCVKNNQTKPYTGLNLLLDADKPDGWQVELTTDWALLCTPQYDLFKWTDKFSLPVSARIGTDFYPGGDGQPHFEVGLHNPTVALGLLAAMLYLEKPVQIKRKEVGGFSVAVPMTFKSGKEVPHTLQQKIGMDATVSRKGRSLKIDFQELNAILCMRQD